VAAPEPSHDNGGDHRVSHSLKVSKKVPIDQSFDLLLLFGEWMKETALTVASK